jgi:hypothetical protein
VPSPPTTTAVTTRAIDCRAGDLDATVRRHGEGAGGHIATLVDLANTGDRVCRLVGYAERVTVTEPGQRPVPAERGSWFPARPAGPVDPGAEVTLILTTTAACASTVRAFTDAPRYHGVEVVLPSGTLRATVPGDGLYVDCGVRVSRFTSWR